MKAADATVWDCRLSEQAGDLAVLVHVDALGGGNLGQAGHGHDLAGQGTQKAGTGGNLHVPDGDGEVPGSAQPRCRWGSG